MPKPRRRRKIGSKKRRERRADAGRTAHWKKAIVTLKAGEKIELA